MKTSDYLGPSDRKDGSQSPSHPGPSEPHIGTPPPSIPPANHLWLLEEAMSFHTPKSLPKDSLYLKGRPFAKAPPLWSHFRVLTSSRAFLAGPQHLPEEAELSTYVCMDSETLARGGGLVGVSVLSQGDAGHTVRRVNTNRILTIQVSLSNITSSGRPSWITPSVLQWSSNFSLHQKGRRGL